MRPGQIKWLILIIPTLTIGIWEYVRHEFLLPYLSMEAGNWLAPVIVFGVTLALLVPLFSLFEETENDLHEAKRNQVILREREHLARELHDGVAQSLFLLSVQVDRLSRSADSSSAAAEAGSSAAAAGSGHAERITELRRTIRETDEYVRQAIAGLRRDPSHSGEEPWLDTVRTMLEQFRRDTRYRLEWSWELNDKLPADSREKIELFSSLREALMNVRKHACEAELVRVSAEADSAGGWRVTVADNGKGPVACTFDSSSSDVAEAAGGEHFGLSMIRRRADEFGWRVSLTRDGGWTVLTIGKSGGGGGRAALPGIDRG